MAGAEAATLARPYARAAFAQALQEGLPAWSRMLALLAEAAQAPPLQRALANPLLDAPDKVALFAKVMQDDLTEEGGNLLALLAEHGRLPLLPGIARLFERLRAQHEKTLTVSIASAYALSKSHAQQLRDALKKRLNKEVSLETSLDPALIGGLLIKVEDTVIDGSVRGRLDKLAQALT